MWALSSTLVYMFSNYYLLFFHVLYAGLKHLELRFRLHAFLATAATHAGTPTTDLAVLYR